MADTSATNNPSPPEHRVRKRRRRTMACTQCRSRKLRCDREYPVCGRCVKSQTPEKCTYEDGFLWQQPNTVASNNAFINSPNRRVSTTNSVAVNNNSSSGAQTPHLLPRVLCCQNNNAHAYARPDATHVEWESKQRPVVEERRDRFLETVLGAPKTEEPYVPSDIFHRSRRPEYYSHLTPSHHNTEYDGTSWLSSPSQKLDISPRIMMRGRETQTRFNGAGILANLVAQVKSTRDMYLRTSVTLRWASVT